MNFDPGESKPGNLVAIATMSPRIDIWDVDVVGAMEPAFTLGESHGDDVKQGFVLVVE